MEFKNILCSTREFNSFNQYSIDTKYCFFINFWADICENWLKYGECCF
ncbi:hypothetical protein PROSTU_00282 [Providencia stuartii ATCC 25827]|uniref:Uncharacterized protein n=1 Tax=Providencia stuartii ATCC 25827 TaxID=471874 RepID=A0AA86YPX4_PROST|nr:hypothetical protein PROSTU_00282 [Providencia stuartii ATCC 25827]